MPNQFNDAIEELRHSFERFKEKQSDNLQSISDRLDRIETRSNRASMGGGMTFNSSESSTQKEHRKAFQQWVTRGRDEDGLLDLQQKAMSIGVGADGGFAVPTAIDAQIEKLLRDISPIRQIARMVPVGTSDYKKLVNTGGLTSGWVSETDARPETDTPQFAEVIPPIGEIYCNPSITQHALDDVFFDAEG